MSATPAVVDALVAALEADAGLAALLGATAEDGRVYVGQARNPNALPYLSVGTSTEGRGGAGATFGARGQTGTEMIHAWVAGDDKRAALALYGEVHRVLDGERLPLVGHEMLVGRVVLVRTLADPTRTAHQAVIEYRVQTRTPA